MYSSLSKSYPKQEYSTKKEANHCHTE